jgi:hypothetical protein
MPIFGIGTASAGFDANGSINFGQRPFAYPVSGFKALCTANLPAPVVTKPSTVMDVKLYTGNGSTQTISGLGFSPDLVWIKNRTLAVSHVLQDTVRGVSTYLASDLTAAEATYSSLGITAFNSDGFTVADVTNGGYRVNGAPGTAFGGSYAAWCWDAGSSTVTNTQGSISSQVRANASAGFSVATLTTPNSGTFTVGHGLNVAPSLVICKARNQAFTWIVYHRSAGAGNVLVLNTTAASAANATIWQNTNPSSTLVYGDVTNWGTANYVMYSFAPVAGYSSMGSYVGNGSSDGAFVHTGFRPRFILIKRTDSSGQWTMYDTARDSSNASKTPLAPNESTAESGFTSGYNLDILSNGFKWRDAGMVNNASGGTYIYFAVAESPFQYARAR